MVLGEEGTALWIKAFLLTAHPGADFFFFFPPPGKRARELIPMFQLGALDRGPITCAAGAGCHGGPRKMVVSRI